MKITDVKTWVVGNPPPGIGGRYFIFVRLTTDGGVSGYGEAYSATFDPHLTARMIEDVTARYLLGQDPHDIENFFRRAYSSGFSQRPDITMMGCVSALEIACWDIIGKEAGKPVHKLIGGRVHETLRSYTYLYPTSGSAFVDEVDDPERNVYNDPELAAQCALDYVAQGFDAVKLDPAGPQVCRQHMVGGDMDLAELGQGAGEILDRVPTDARQAAQGDDIAGHGLLLLLSWPAGRKARPARSARGDRRPRAAGRPPSPRCGRRCGWCPADAR